MSTEAINTTDLTGLDPDFKVVDKRFVVFQGFQIIDFEEPVFDGSIIVHRVNNDSTVTELNRNQDWSTSLSTLKAINAISQAKLQDMSFSQNLVTGIQITSGVVNSPFTITVSYQAFNRPYNTYPAGTNGPAATPALMLHMLEHINYLASIANPVSNPNAATVSTTTVLEEDYSGYATDNLIEDEIHIVNVPSNRFIVRPANGSFYLHDLKLTLDDGTVLKGENDVTAGATPDYLVRGLNHGKTRVSSNKSGVYDYIVITTNLVGNVHLKYHAFGGEVTAGDFNELRDQLIAILNLLANGKFINTDNLPEQLIITQILRRLAYVEEAVRHYPEVEFDYTIQKFTASIHSYSTDNWVDVAEAAHGPWTEMNPLPNNGYGSFRVAIPSRDYCADFTLSYDLINNKLKFSDVTVQSSSYDVTGLDHFTNQVIPKFRLVYRDNDISAGIVLQMSINSRVADTVEVSLTDCTGTSSIWTLIDTNKAEHPNTELTTTLADGTTIWVDPDKYPNNNNGSKKTAEVSLLPREYTAWVGSVAISTIDAVSDRFVVDDSASNKLHGIWETSEAATSFVEGTGLKLTNLINNGDIGIEQIHGVRVYVYDRYAKQMRIEESTLNNNTGNTFSGAVVYFVEDMCGLVCKLTETISDVTPTSTVSNDRIINKYSLVVFSTTGTNSQLNDRFDLKQIDLITRG